MMASISGKSAITVGIFILAGLCGLGFAKHCGTFGSYDALCVTDDAVFLVSVSPCHDHKKNDSIHLHVVYTKGVGPLKLKYTEIKGNINHLVKYGSSLYAWTLERHFHPTDGPSAGYLHVTFEIKNITGGNTGKAIYKLDLNFYLGREANCNAGFTGASFYPLPDCSESKRTSNFSTFCISNKSVSIDKKSQGIFIVTMDPCSIPYSYNVLAYFPSKNIEVVNRYTAPKTNSFVPVESTTCGFKMKRYFQHPDFPMIDSSDTGETDFDYEDWEMEEEVQVKLSYGCNDQTAKNLIDDYYFPDDALMCPLPKCDHKTALSRSCKVDMLGRNNIMKQLTVNVTLNHCLEKRKAKMVLTLEGKPKPLVLDLHRHERADFHFDGSPQTNNPRWQTEVTDGYIPLEGGKLSVHFELTDDHEHDEKKRGPDYYTVELVRHYPREEEIFPIFMDEFKINKCNQSDHLWHHRHTERYDHHPGHPRAGLSYGSGHSRLHPAVTAIIVISVIMVVIVIGTLLFFRYRRYKKTPGLPYQMELHNEEFEKEDL